MKHSPLAGRVVVAALAFVALVFFVAGAPLSSALPTQVNVKLSGSMQTSGDINFPWPSISPDSRTVVYAADAATDGVYELFSAPTTGAAPPVQLSQLHPFGMGITRFQITPDSRRVVYIATQEVAFATELYTTPIGGGATTKLNGPLVAHGNVFAMTVAPNSERIVYVADAHTDEQYELFSVSIHGGAVTRLNTPLPFGYDIWDVLIAPDSTRVVYKGGRELFSVPIDGGATIRLNDPLVAGGSVAEFKISPDGARVVYKADQQTDGVEELFSVPIGGGPVVKLNGPLAAGGVIRQYEISADSDQVVYRAGQEMAEAVALYSVPIGGGPVTNLSGPPVAGRDVFLCWLTPDGQHVVYMGDLERDDLWEFYSVSIRGGVVTKLGSPPIPAGNFPFVIVRISPDSSRVVYWNEGQADKIYSVPISGGPWAQLYPPKAGSSVMGNIVIAGAPNRVIYLADQLWPGRMELFSVPIDGGAATRLNGILAGFPFAWGDVSNFVVSPDSKRVVYWADQDVDEQEELYATFDDSVLVNEAFVPLVTR